MATGCPPRGGRCACVNECVTPECHYRKETQTETQRTLRVGVSGSAQHLSEQSALSCFCLAPGLRLTGRFAFRTLLTTLLVQCPAMYRSIPPTGSRLRMHGYAMRQCVIVLALLGGAQLTGAATPTGNV